MATFRVRCVSTCGVDTKSGPVVKAYSAPDRPGPSTVDSDQRIPAGPANCPKLQALGLGSGRGFLLSGVVQRRATGGRQDAQASPGSPVGAVASVRKLRASLAAVSLRAARGGADGDSAILQLSAARCVDAKFNQRCRNGPHFHRRRIVHRRSSRRIAGGSWQIIPTGDSEAAHRSCFVVGAVFAGRVLWCGDRRGRDSPGRTLDATEVICHGIPSGKNAVTLLCATGPPPAG